MQTGPAPPAARTIPPTIRRPRGRGVPALAAMAAVALGLTVGATRPLAQQDDLALPPLPDTIQPLAPPLRLDQMPDTFRGDETRGPSPEVTTPAVQENAAPLPTPEGTRSPNSETSTRTAALYDELAAVRRAPPLLDGTPVARPNPLASEPAKEMEPDPRGMITNLFPENYVE